MLCEMCSVKQASVKADIEGARLNVCDACARYGKILGRISVPAPAGKKQAAPAAPAKATETVQVIRSDYARIIKLARERLLLKQEDFAKKLNERESLLHKVESGHMMPDLTLARKLEKALHITLVQQVELEPASADPKDKAAGVTIGDLIKLRK